MMRIVRRNWGWYWTIIERKHFKIKLLRFSKDKPMSKQFHNMRNELWLSLSDGSYKHIPIGEVHDFCAKKTTYVVEIQYGEKCKEEDIIRV